MKNDQIHQAMAHLDYKWIEEAATPVGESGKKMRKVLLTAALCAVIAIPVFAAVSGWSVKSAPGSDKTVQAQPVLSGTHFTEQDKKRFSLFLNEYGSSGSFQDVTELEEKTGIDLLWSEQLWLKVDSGIALQPSEIQYHVYGGQDYLFTGGAKCLFFLPTGEGEAPSRNALQSMLQGLTETMGDLCYVTVDFAAKTGAAAPDITYHTFSKDGQNAFSQYVIEGLGVTAEVVCNSETRSATAYFIAENIAYEVYVRPSRDSDFLAEEILKTVLESLE
jgi:hypothetical protein